MTPCPADLEDVIECKKIEQWGKLGYKCKTIKEISFRLNSMTLC
jgi:hypothetical protein